jgi:5-(carboxyamino)imidazole ribonucleotide mutase
MSNPLIGVVMGSDSDWPTMKQAVDILEEFGVPFEKRVVSAHRTPDDMANYGKEARNRGIRIIIAGAGGAAHLPGMLASHTTLPVIGVPIQTSALGGVDSLYSIVQMPNGIPVATVAIGKAQNAGLLALRILGSSDESISKKLENYHKEMAEASRKKTENLK